MNDDFDINGKYRIINYYTGKEEQEDITCNTISCGYRYYLILQKNDNVEVDPNKELYIPNEDDNKTLFYFECSAFPINNLTRFKQQMCGDNNKCGDNSFLSKYGLFLVSSFLLTDRTKEKGVSIDVIRNQFMDNYILPKLVKSRSVEVDTFITSVFLEGFNHFFIAIQKNAKLLTNTNINNELQQLDQVHQLQLKETTSHEFYKKKQSELMLESFKKYGATVVGDDMNDYSFNKWFQLFNDQLLDSPRGGNTHAYPQHHSSFPSFRQLINWILILFDRYNTKSNKGVRFEKSGGDALRYYLPEILHTSDIDTKLFYTPKPRDKQIFRKIQDTIILLIVFLMEYMETNKYFRFDISREVYFGTYTFKLTFDTFLQENVLSCRYLRNFAVPLLSIDLRLNYSITLLSINGNDNYNIDKSTEPFTQTPKLKFASKYDNAILDVGFNQSDHKIISEKNNFNRHVEVDQYLNNTPYHSGVQFNDNPNLFQLAPLPTINYLIYDIKGMYSNEKNREARIAAGKHEKDMYRLKLLKTIEETNLHPELEPEIIRILDQITKVPHEFIYNKNNFVNCCISILSNANMQLEDIKTYVDNYDTIITELNKYIPNLGKDIILFSMYLRDEKIQNKKLAFSKETRVNIKNETLKDVEYKYKKIIETENKIDERKQNSEQRQLTLKRTQNTQEKQITKKKRGGKRSTSKNKKQGNYKNISRNKYIKLKNQKGFHLFKKNLSSK
jgi:hypothetical protein